MGPWTLTTHNNFCNEQSFFFQISFPKSAIFQTWIQKSPIPRQEFRNGPKNEQLLLLLAQIVVSCSNNQRHRGGCQGASGLAHSSSLRVVCVLGGTLFLNQFLEPFFYSKVVIFAENSSQNGAKIAPFGSHFLENMRKQKSVCRLRRRVRIACEPIPWRAQSVPKIKEKT